MNQFTQILEKAASQLDFDFNGCQSDKSEAADLLIACSGMLPTETLPSVGG